MNTQMDDKECLSFLSLSLPLFLVQMVNLSVFLTFLILYSL